MTEPTFEFVVFDAEGNEVDWVDPVLIHSTEDEGVHEVSNGHGEYRIVIPEGGRYEIRERNNPSSIARGTQR